MGRHFYCDALEQLSKQLEPNYQKLILEHKKLIIDVTGTNPREIKRFINTFTITSSIYSSNHIDLDAHLIKQVLITKWPELAFLLYSNKAFLDIIEKYTELVSDKRLETFKNQKDILPAEYSGVIARSITDNTLWTILKQYHSSIFCDEK